jgi:hypothetical protein
MSTKTASVAGIWATQSPTAKLAKVEQRNAMVAGLQSEPIVRRRSGPAVQSIGELSPFHMEFGYYAKRCKPGVRHVLTGWEQRLVGIHNPKTRGATGLGLEIHDLVASTLLAG